MKQLNYHSTGLRLSLSRAMECEEAGCAQCCTEGPEHNLCLHALLIFIGMKFSFIHVFYSLDEMRALTIQYKHLISLVTQAPGGC